MSELFKMTLKEVFQEKTKGGQTDRNQLLSRIDELNTRLKNAREMVADQKLDSEDFRELKLDCSNQITQLEAKLAGCSVAEKSIDGLLNHAVNTLGRLDTLYEEGTVSQKRQIISSIFPEKLTFDGFQYRTFRINEAARLIYTLGNGFSETKNRKSSEISHLSGWVVPTGIEPVSKV